MNLSVGYAIGQLVCRRRTGGSIAVATTRVNEDGVQRRRAALRIVDRQLTKGNFKLAVSLVKQLQRQPSPAGLCGFGAARHLTETSALQSLLDAILDSIKSSLQTSTFEESSVTDEDNELYLEDDMVEHKQVVQHEAGHFLVGYLLGVLPKQYKFSCVEDKIADANVKFVGFEFLTELEDVALSNKTSRSIKAGHRANKKVSSTVLNKFACVIVGGLVAEHLAFGHSKGHHGDMEKLYRVLNWLQFTEDEANTLTRWAVLNTLTILNRHTKAISTLAEAMSRGRPVGNCIHFIESNLNHQDI